MTLTFKKEKIGLIVLFNSCFLLFSLLFFRFSLAQDLIIIEKFSRTLYLVRDGQILRAYPVSLGWNPNGPKKVRGDGATPEGIYEIIAKRPSAKYGLFLALDYPNLKDVNLAWWEGRLSYDEYLICIEAAQKKRPNPSCPLGFGIGIHGGGVFREEEGKKIRDWTYGCIALNDTDIKELSRLVSLGIPVFIYDLKRPLFEILKNVVFPVEVPGTRLLPWWGEWEFNLKGLVLRASLWENHQGLRRLILFGLESSSKKLLFYYRDDNADGVLSSWERKNSLFHPLWAYDRVQQKILELLPVWVEKKLAHGKGG